MSVEIKVIQKNPMQIPPTYIGICCREWVLAVGMHGKCGICNTVPVFLRPNTRT